MRDFWLAAALHRSLLAAMSVPVVGSASCAGSVASSDDAAVDAAADVGTCDPLPNDAALVCGTQYDVEIAGNTSTCSRDPVGGAGVLTAEECRHVCGVTSPDHASCYAETSRYVRCAYSCAVEGRRPRGLRAAPVAAPTALGAHFARVAHMEAASILAFTALSDDLEEHGAPASLVVAARLAATDETRHARAMTAMARRFGATVPPVRAESRTHRSLEELALENEIEGCVRETYGALQALHQARYAKDRAVREAMTTVAAEEETHAALAWAIAAWARSRLDDAARTRLEAARALAIADLEAALGVAPSEEVAALAGVPSRRRAAALLDAAKREVWS